MGIAHRVGDLFRTKANKALDRAEDPRETLDYAYQQQIALLQQVRRGLADVATSRKRIELQRKQLGRSAEALQAQAQQALGAGREDLAREALGRRAETLAQDQALQEQLVSLQAEEEKLTTATQRLEAQVEAFRTRKETIKASYTAAEAQTRISEAVTGVSGQMEDVGTAIQRAQDRTEELQARAGALDELTASGALDDPLGARHDELDDQLEALTAGDTVEAELAAMKAELTTGTEGPASLEPAPDENAPEAKREGNPEGTGGTKPDAKPEGNGEGRGEGKPEPGGSD